MKKSNSLLLILIVVVLLLAMKPFSVSDQAFVNAEGSI